MPTAAEKNPKIRPYWPSDETHYSRLFPPVGDCLDDNLRGQLTKLGQSMMRRPEDPTPIPFHFRKDPPYAGYTYFGQFIDHDLTWDQTPLDEAHELAPCQTTNHRTPWLDLDSLYGDGPESNSHSYLYSEDRASFRLGGYSLSNDVGMFDVPLDDRGNPQIADARNNDNLIVRQVHAMFLKLHNVAVRELPEKLPAHDRFRRARDRVRWQYQWLVRNDFLKAVCDTLVYQEVMAGRCLIDWDSVGFSVPVEFAQGAFRFGHSMARAMYTLNPDIPEDGAVPSEPTLPLQTSLGTLFAEARNRLPISLRRVIGWRSFLVGPRGAELSSSVDTGVAAAMVAPLVPPEIPVRTLLRGAATRLATGEEVAKAFKVGIPSISNQELAAYSKPPWGDLIANGFKDKTPLWYYCLLEAQLEEHGGRLGSAGSRIVAEVIEGSLRADADSFLSRVGSKWMPPPWTAFDGKPYAIRNLFGVAVVTGLAPRPD